MHKLKKKWIHRSILLKKIYRYKKKTQNHYRSRYNSLRGAKHFFLDEFVRNSVQFSFDLAKKSIYMYIKKKN